MINQTVTVQAGDVITIGRSEAAEEAAEEQPTAVRSVGNLAHRVIRSRAGDKRRIEDAVRAEPGQAVPGHVIHETEVTADDNLTAWLESERVDVIVRASRQELGIKSPRRNPVLLIVHDHEHRVGDAEKRAACGTE